MVKAASENRQAFLSFCERDNFGCRILNEFRLYENDPGAHFFFSGDAALSAHGEWAILCGKADDEILTLLSFLPCKRLFCLQDAVPQSAFSRLDRRGIVGVLQTAPETSGETESITAETLRDIYSCLQYNLPPEDRTLYGDWYVEMSHRLRHDFCHIRAVRRDETIVSLALSAAESEKTAVLGSVRTLPNWQHRGFADATVRALSRDLIEKGKTCYLCAVESVFPLYQKIGYQNFNIWWELTL